MFYQRQQYILSNQLAFKGKCNKFKQRVQKAVNIPKNFKKRKHKKIHEGSKKPSTIVDEKSYAG